MLHVRYYGDIEDLGYTTLRQQKSGFISLTQVSPEKSEERQLRANEYLANESRTKKDESGYIPLDEFVRLFPLDQRRIMEAQIRINELEYIRIYGKQGIVDIGLIGECITTEYWTWLSMKLN